MQQRITKNNKSEIIATILMFNVSDIHDYKKYIIINILL